MKKMKSKLSENKTDKENQKSTLENKTFDKNSSIENINNNSIQPNTVQDFLKDNKKPVLFKEFKGFFFKKFNLTAFKKERDDSRERSKSPEYKYKPNHKKGNGVPDDLLKRLRYVAKLIKSKDFVQYYLDKPTGKNVTFETILDYIISYSKTHNELESVLMVYYFVCNDIKYYDKEALKKLKEKYKNKSEYSIFLDTNFFDEGYIPKPKEIYMKGIALNPKYFANVFEYFLKKMEIKYKHIEGYCKLMEENDTEK